MRTVFSIGAQAVKEGVPKVFLGVPIIIDEYGEPDSRINEYLLARRNGDWAADQPYQGAILELSGRKVLRANLGYLRNRAYQLDVLRRWCLEIHSDYRGLGDTELDRFAEDLEEGVLTGFEGGLMPQSVNQYLTSAIDFLNYGAHRGWRSPLKLKVMMTKKRSYSASRRPLVMRRINPSEIVDWYAEADVDRFIDEFYTAPVKLAARLMHRMGLRLSEALALRKTDFPSIGQFEKDPTCRSIRVVGKFRKVRRVPLDAEILSFVERFWIFDRRRYAQKLAAPSDLLIIGPMSDGFAGPLKARYVQKEFVRAREAAGFKSLSPHLLRHHYAVHFLVKAWRRKAAALSSLPTTFDFNIGQAALSTDLLMLKESLGHEKLDTTLKYLHAVSYLCGSNLPERYSDELDGKIE